jgi:hypothetical protein
MKVLSFTLALAALSPFVASCGSGGPAQVRFVQAIQDAPTPLDIDVSNANNSPKQQFSHVSFLGVQPNQPGRTSVPSGNDTVTGFLTGTTTQVFSGTVGWASGLQYTLVATGFSKTGTNGSNVVLLSIPDNIPSPPTEDVSFRVIHASPSGPGTVDVYIELNPSTAPTSPPTIQGLPYMQASNFVSLAFNPNNDPTPPGFTVYVCASGSVQPIVSEPIFPASAGAVRTLVLTDVQNGTTMSSSFLELTDAN